MQKFLSLLGGLALLCSIFTHSSFAQRNDYDPEVSRLTEQLTTDIVAAGFSIGATLSGNVPLALSAGFLTKYIVTYGIGGVKALIEHIKGFPPQDLGHINLYHVYLIHVKRNLYKSIISIRKDVDKNNPQSVLQKELNSLEKYVLELCQNQTCLPDQVDQSLVNYGFLQIALDAKGLLELDQFVSDEQISHTYHYLLLLYLDVMMAENQLYQYQVVVLANQVNDLKKLLEENQFISNFQKEYQYQMALNLSLRWRLMMQKRRVQLGKILQVQLGNLRLQNQQDNQDIRGQ
jgi:hypothetical protein